MKLKDFLGFAGTTAVLALGLGIILTLGMRAAIAENWEAKRCDPYVVPIASWFKPATDPRTPSQFAHDNWLFCQKQYVQDALRTAAQVPQDLAQAQGALVDVTRGISSGIADVFFNVWNFIHEAYSSFLDRMGATTKLFHNFLINLNYMLKRAQAAGLAIVYGLISLVIAFVDFIKVSLLAVIIVIGILLIMLIWAIFIVAPISGVILTMSALLASIVVIVFTAIAAAFVTEKFLPGACFAADTWVGLKNGADVRIDSVRVGMTLADGGCVTAVHQFKTGEPLWNLHGIRVTGDHLVEDPDQHRIRWIRVADHPQAVAESSSWFSSKQEVWCLTTTTRNIWVRTSQGGLHRFADWEEIPEDDRATQLAWYRAVWRRLNDTTVDPVDPGALLDGETGVSPDAWISVVHPLGFVVQQRAQDVAVGARVLDGLGGTTAVVGRVEIEGDSSTDAILLPETGDRTLVSGPTWTRTDAKDRWLPAAQIGEPTDLHPMRWIHLYTAAGTLQVGSWTIRDASDVGLNDLRSLVDSLILKH